MNFKTKILPLLVLTVLMGTVAWMKTPVPADTQMAQVVSTTAPRAQVLSPNGGETLEIGSSYQMTLSQSNIPSNGQLQAGLIKEGDTMANSKPIVAGGSPNLKGVSFTPIVPTSDLQPGRYKVVLACVTSVAFVNSQVQFINCDGTISAIPTILDSSDNYFTLVAPGALTAVYIGPGITNITQSFKTGDTVTITGTNLSTMTQVNFVKGGSFAGSATIYAGQATQTSISFRAPTLAAGIYSVYVAGVSGQTTSQSNQIPVTVLAAPAPVSTTVVPVATTTIDTSQTNTPAPSTVTSVGNSTPTQPTNPLNAYVAFTANTNTVASGANFSLQWNARQVSSVNITNQFKSCIGGGFNTGTKVTGIVTLIAKTTNINTTQQFLLTCKTAKATVTKVITITITPPATFGLGATPGYFYVGKSTNLTFNIGSAYASCSLKDSVTGVTKAIDPSSQGGVYSSPSTATLTLTCTSKQGVVSSKAITVPVLPPAVSNITFSNILPNSMRLNWSPVPSAVGYALYRDEEFVATTAQPFYQEDPILVPDSDYSYDIVPLGDLITPAPVKLDVTLFALADTTPKNFFAWISSGVKSLLAAAGVIPDLQSPSYSKNRNTANGHSGAPKDLSRTGNVSVLAIVVAEKGKPYVVPLPSGTTFPNEEAKNYLIDIGQIYPDWFGYKVNVVDTPDHVKKVLFADTNSVSKYYLNASFGQLVINPNTSAVAMSGSATGQFEENTTDFDIENVGTSPKQNTQILTKVNTDVNSRGYDLSKYDIIIYVMPFSFQTPLAGIVDKVTPFDQPIKGNIFINGVEPSFAYAHEIGHKLGLSHAHGYECAILFATDCNVKYYHDPVDTMGNINLINFDDYRKNLVGWISGEEKITKTNQGTFKIIAVEHRETKLVSIDTPGSKYFFDYHDRYGTFTNFTTGVGGTMIKSTIPAIAKSDPDAYRDTDTYLVELNPGEKVFMLQDGGSYQKVDQKWKVVQLSHIPASSNIFVRFDEQVSGLTARAGATANTVKLSWQAVSKASGSTVGYKVYVNSTSTPPIDVGPVLTYTTSITPGVDTKFYISAYDTLPIGLATNPPKQKYDIHDSVSDPVTFNTNLPVGTVTTPLVRCDGAPIDVLDSYKGTVLGPQTCTIQTQAQPRYIHYKGNNLNTQCGTWPDISDYGEDHNIICLAH